MIRRFVIIFLLLIGTINCQKLNKLEKGADRLLSSYTGKIKNKTISLVINHTSVLADKSRLVDKLLTIPHLKIKNIFTPEHGLLMSAEAGAKVSNSTYKDIPVISLYGSKKMPDVSDLAKVDYVVFDIQDIGTRFYTYISTLFYIVKSCSQYKIPLIVLDRPNPLGGEKVCGPLVTDSLISFVGIADIPIVHGMTTGELAIYFNKYYFNSSCDVEVIKLKNWNRKYIFNSKSDNWIIPSPNIPDFETACLYPAVCILEATNISEGRGTLSPFKIFGAPFIKPHQLIKELSKFNSVIRIDSVEFTPVDIKGKATNVKHKNQICKGLKLQVTDFRKFDPVKFAITLIKTLKKYYPGQLVINKSWFNKLMGDEKIIFMLDSDYTTDEIFNYIGEKERVFKLKRQELLLY